MTMKRKKRAMVLVGAGASLEFGAPSTAQLTKNIGQKVKNDPRMKKCGGDQAYQKIFNVLSRYLKDGTNAVNFEHIYHCAHELLFTFEPVFGAFNEYRPILQPFTCRRIQISEQVLRELIKRMVEFLFEELSETCKNPTIGLGPLSSFLERLRRNHITRIYTTNYDDFLLQAACDLYTGFDSEPSPDAKGFDRRAFWQETDTDCVFHLHGSVHLGFPFAPAPSADFGDLCWFDDRAEALRHSSHPGSGRRRMDGSQTVRTAMITGLDKLSHLQQQPFSQYYASMARDAMTSDIIYVIGYGLGDLHLNTWLAEARRMEPMPPLIFVDCWRNGFPHDMAFEQDYKINEMFRALRMYMGTSYNDVEYGNGWTLAKNSRDRNCAIWDKGFLAFLKAPNELDDVLTKLVPAYIESPFRVFKK